MHTRTEGNEEIIDNGQQIAVTVLEGHPQFHYL